MASNERSIPNSASVMKSRIPVAVLKTADKRRTFSEIANAYPHNVKLKKGRIADGYRSNLRTWFKDNNIRIYSVSGDTADVVWDKTWTTFYFKQPGHATLFSLNWL